MYTGRSETTSRFSGGKMLARRCGTPPRQGKQSVWTPTAKGGWSQTHYFFRAEARTHFYKRNRGDLQWRPKVANETEKSPFG